MKTAQILLSFVFLVLIIPAIAFACPCNRHASANTSLSDPIPRVYTNEYLDQSVVPPSQKEVATVDAVIANPDESVMQDVGD